MRKSFEGPDPPAPPAAVSDNVDVGVHGFPHEQFIALAADLPEIDLEVKDPANTITWNHLSLADMDGGNHVLWNILSGSDKRKFLF